MLTHRRVTQFFSVVVILSMMFSSVHVPSISAQGEDTVKRQYNPQTGKINFIGPESGRSLSASKALGTLTRPQDPAMALAKRFGPEFGLKNPERDLKEMKTHQSEDGRLNVRYQQHYQGIPVMGGELNVITNRNGDLYSMNGEASSSLSLSTTPTIDSEQARQTALQAAALWYAKTPEDFVASVPELWIYDESLLQPSTRLAELVWRMEVTPQDAGMPVRELVLVNAQSGNISLHFNQVDMAWSLSAEASIAQDTQPTPTPQPTETPLPTETSEPAVTATPIPDVSESPVPDTAKNQITTLTDTTLYVTTTGNDSNSCFAAESPCATINGAIAKASADSLIKVASGTYTGTTGNIVVISKGLTLSGGWDNAFTVQSGASIIDGGGVHNGILANASGSVVVVENFVIQNSYTTSDSGGIYIYGANFTLKNSAVINNRATNKGAGIFIINNASLTILNSTISGNTTNGSGGGIYAVSGTVTINNSTIAYNTSNGTGGGLAKDSATISIRNSILARNTASTNGPDCFGAINWSDHNILGNIAGCTVTSGAGDQFNVDPLIESSLTGTLPLHPLQADSPAINAGDNNTCLAIDQRGMPRPNGSACDIGAYEHTVTGGLFVISGSNQTSRPGTSFALPFEAYVLDSSANPVAGVTVTFTAPDSGASGTFDDSGTRVTTAVTDSYGYAISATFTANSQGGSYLVSATADSYGFSTAFTLTNSIADLYVAPAGSDSNACNLPTAPCQTINAAITKAVPENTIAIAKGTYTGTGTYVVNINKALTLSGGWESDFSQQTGWSVIDGQNARTGVGVFNVNGGDVGSTIDRFKITNGYSSSSAGGISVHVPLILNNSIVIRNRTGGGSSGSAGGIFAASDLTLNNTTVQENASTNKAGGILIYVSNKLTLNNSTITGNQAVGGYGGGILLSGGSSASVQITNIFNSTIANNSAKYGGGIAIETRSPGRIVTIKNSIIANNSASTGPDCKGTVNELDHSMIANTADCIVSTGSGNSLNVNPWISLYPIGGWGYHSLHVDSPAKDTGVDCLANDQRGISRPQGTACDMGAYEYAAASTPASFGDAGGSYQKTPTTFAFPNPLAVYVIDHDGNPVGGAVVNFIAPATGASGTFADTGTNTTTISTDSTGLAIAPVFTANAELGTYHVTTMVSGLSGSIEFVLTNNDFFVSPTGNDASTCDSPTSTCLTINAAITKASSGDVIKIASGTYTGTGLQVVSLTKNLMLSGGWDTTFSSQNGYSVIDGQGARVGIQNTSTSSTLERFIIQNGYTTSTGAGINHQQGTLTIDQSLITNNRANSGGGGIFSAGNLIINGSTIRNNSASGGGAIAISLSTNALTLSNSTLTGNQTTGSGGAIVLYSSSESGDPGAITIQNSTIVNNAAQSNGGGFHNYGGTPRPVNITNSILARNTAKTSGPNCYGVINIFDHSLIDNASNCTLANGTGNVLNTDPLVSTYPVGSLGLHALQSGSPAINAGANCVSADQRGVSRPQGIACDMGAYEYTTSGAPASFGIAAGSNQRAGQLFPFALPLVVYVVDRVGSPVSNVEVTFTAPAYGASGTFANSGANTVVVSTNSEGLAFSPTLTANSELGQYNVTATVAGLAGSVNFALTNATWFVAITGNDGNSCSTPAAPCLTTNAAINKALPGDVIKVATGVYAGYSTNIAKSLTLSGGWNTSFAEQTGSSIIDGSVGYDGMIISGSNVSVTRFVIRNGYYGIRHSGGVLHFEQGALIANRNGIYNSDGDTTFINTTISGNQGGGTAGSAISNVRGTTTIQFSTITNNSGSYAIYSANGYAYIKIGSSILAGNTNADCMIGSNSNISEGNNIFGRSPACSGSAILQPTDRIGTDPKLLPLIAGSYHPILPGGPAYDAANSSDCPATDQRGATRPTGIKCDIGAIEFRATGTTPANLIAYEGMGQSMPPGGPAATRLKAVVLDVNGDGVPGKTITFTGPASGASLVFDATGTYTSTAISDVNGIATSSAFSANNMVGSYMVSATVTGLPGSANFQLFNGSHKIKTYTANNGTALPGVLLCDQSQPNCTNGSNPHADAAHTYAIGTYNLYMSQYQRDSIDNHNMPVISTVHYSSGYANAAWTGSQMIYGDAYGFALADDVVAHELTHGVTQYESNLFYYYQSGAINESFSDLWGEYYDQINGQGNDTTSVKWLMGEDISGMGVIRSMSNPPAYSDPDKISSTYYYEGASDNGGVHTNSGVNNKAVYLMVDGGTFNNKTVTALGWEKTAAIYYEANTNLLSSGADYSDLYYALQQACTNLIGQKGITSDDCAEVKNAVDAVEMNGQPAVDFNSDAPICDAGTSLVDVFSDDLESGTANWTFNNGTYTRWQLDSAYGPNAHSGAHSLYADDYPGITTDARAQLDPVTLPSRAYLRFAHAYDFQASSYNYDGGVLEYSINGGSTWADAGPLIDFNGYKGPIYTGTNNPLQGRSAFVGTSHGYISTRLNLTSLAGKTVRFRWRMGLDQSGYAWGWWVDDVTIYRCLPPDAIPPTVSSVTRADPDMTQAASIDFGVTFSESVSGVDMTAPFNDFALTTTGVTGASIAGVSGSGTTYTVTVNTGSGNGTIRMDVKDDDSIVDAYNNPLGDYGIGNGNFTTGEQYSILKSAAKPGVPVLLSPTNGSLTTGLQPLLDWKETSPAAHHYQIQIAANSTFTALALDDANVSSSNFIPASTLLPGKLYYWRVRALNVVNTASGWSSVRTFKTPLTMPVLASPANVEILNTDRPAFDWDDAPGAIQYVLQMSASNTFSALLVNTTTSTSQYTATKDLPQNKVLYWRVQAKTSAVTGPWSVKWSFKTGNPPSVPALAAPANNALVKDYTPLLNWNNSTVPTGTTFKHYELQVDDNNDFSSPELTTTRAVSDFTPGSDLASNTKYYWRVRAVNTIDHVSGWSPVWSFHTVIPAPGSLTMIPTGDPLRPSFEWDDAAGPETISGYTIQMSTSSSFGTFLVNSTTINSFYTMLKDLPSGKTIYWRVRVNGANGPSAWTTAQFTAP